jgi:hypothetical protein
MGPDDTFLNGMVIGRDDKPVAVGVSGKSSTPTGLLVRLKATGQLDFSAAVPSGTLNAVALQSDGRILVVGDSGSAQGAVYRTWR